MLTAQVHTIWSHHPLRHQNLDASTKPSPHSSRSLARRQLPFVSTFSSQHRNFTDRISYPFSAITKKKKKKTPSWPPFSALTFSLVDDSRFAPRKKSVCSIAGFYYTQESNSHHVQRILTSGINLLPELLENALSIYPRANKEKAGVSILPVCVLNLCLSGLLTCPCL
jgi:hypothetical protein